MKKILLIACLAVSIVTTVAIAKTSNETQTKKQVNSIGWNFTSHNHQNQSMLLADISDSQQIPCQWCGKKQPAYSNWYICNNCGFRVCSQCTNRHYGPYKKSPDGSGQCSQCSRGRLIPATYKNGQAVRRP